MHKTKRIKIGEDLLINARLNKNNISYIKQSLKSDPHYKFLKQLKA